MCIRDRHKASPSSADAACVKCLQRSFLNFVLVNFDVRKYLQQMEWSSRFAIQMNQDFDKIDTTGPQKQTYKNRATKCANTWLVAHYVQFGIQISSLLSVCELHFR